MTHHVLETLSVKDAPFFHDGTFPFADGLTTIIGGRGTCKTALAHLVRHNFGLAIAAAFADAFTAHTKAALGDGTVTCAVRTASGARYVCSRARATSLRR